MVSLKTIYVPSISFGELLLLEIKDVGRLCGINRNINACTISTNLTHKNGCHTVNNSRDGNNKPTFDIDCPYTNKAKVKNTKQVEVHDNLSVCP